jgi:SAM-dependent methyltransferase
MGVDTSLLRCPACHARISESGMCSGCETSYSTCDETIDLLVDPSAEVQNELTGLAKENHIDISDGFGAVKFMDRTINTPAELFRSGPHYYGHTLAAYCEALSRAQITADMAVLEIGSDRTHHKLRMIQDLCSVAYGLNIFFHVPQPPTSAFVTRVLADMCDLPFADDTLDLVITSATLHHSPDLGATIRGIWRVLKPGGRAILVNEPIEGSAKRFGFNAGHDRDELIHEDPVTWAQWSDAIVSSGLSADHFLPAWFVDRVTHGEQLGSVRFAGLANALRPVLRRPMMADMLRASGRIPGQRVLGLPLNAVLWKKDHLRARDKLARSSASWLTLPPPSWPLGSISIGARERP